MKTFIAIGFAVFVALVTGRLLAAEPVAAGATNLVESLPALSPFGEAKVIRNIAYTTNAGPRQNFDLYLPGMGKKPFPLLVWIHGGGWSMGSKDWINVRYLVRHGYAIASIDYRMTDEGAFPMQIQDCNTALNFILAHAPEYGVDGKKFAVGGGSAGGHLALLLGMARRQPGFGADPAVKPAAILDLFGPTDFTKTLEQLQAIHSEKGIQAFQDAVPKLLGGRLSLATDKAEIASPVNYVNGNSPPVFILHGGSDDVVPIAQSEELRAALDRAGVPNRYMEVQGAGHDGAKFSTPDIEAAEVDFLDGIFKKR
ncbi:MAG TPA: alpha/beta hydrolase [Candidatus Acidoferrales bacterium]|jgi:acetyl esterase/lipase|nr:alpha/beta hydrolase [Candidatus Acidoferrales bacterium]